MNKICFIINPLSGDRAGTHAMVRLIGEILTPAGREYEIAYIKGPGDGARLSREGVARGCDLVVAAGGDGTVNAVALGLVGSTATLAVIPAGSGNGFARSMGIPLDHPAALRLLLAPEIITMDVGTINDRYFFNMAGIGLDAAISKSFEQLWQARYAHLFSCWQQKLFLPINQPLLPFTMQEARSPVRRLF